MPSSAFSSMSFTHYEAPIHHLITFVQDQSAFGGLAGQEGFEPPTRGFGDRRSANWSYWPLLFFPSEALLLQIQGPTYCCRPLMSWQTRMSAQKLFFLFMRSTLFAKLAEFLYLKPFCLRLLVLHACIIFPLALCARDHDQLPWHLYPISLI